MKFTGMLSSGKKSMYCQVFVLIVAIVGIHQTSLGQVVHEDDVHIIGDLEVGNSGTTGNISITGDKGNSALPGLKITGDGGVVFMGTSGTGTIPATGAGVRMMWYPKKAAFRAGSVSGNSWDDASTGLLSVAFGSATASGTNSAAFGSAFAAGNYSAAFNMAYSSGVYSFATGWGSTATGHGSFAGGGDSLATGRWAVAFGSASYASGDRSFAIGATASGTNSFAFGTGAVASGLNSTAGGTSSIASGNRSFALGDSVTAVSVGSFVIGRNNRVEGDATTWVDTDPLFVIGNGTGVVSDTADVKNRNALTLLKNGKMTLFGASGTTPVIVLDPTTAQISVAGQPLLSPNSSGYVGIGTSSPTSALSVHGGVTISNGGAGSVRFTNDAIGTISYDLTGTGTYRNLLSRSTDANGTHTVLQPLGGTNPKLIVRNVQNTADLMTVQNNTGNVGIGATAPDYALVVARNTSGAMNFVDISGNNTAGDGGSGIVLSDNNVGKWTIFQRNQSPASALHFATGEGGASGNAKLTILQDGRVGVGTINPESRFTVSGTFVWHSAGDSSPLTVQASGDQRIFLKVKNTHSDGSAYAPVAGIDLDVANNQTATRARTWLQTRSIRANGGGGDTALTVPVDFQLYVNNKDQTTASSGLFASSIGMPGTLALKVDSTGKVGVGTASPQAKLDVKGTVRFERQGDILMGEFGNP